MAEDGSTSMYVSVLSEIKQAKGSTCIDIVNDVTTNHGIHIVKIHYTPHCQKLPGVNHIDGTSNFVLAFLDTEGHHLIYQQSIALVVLLIYPVSLEIYSQQKHIKEVFSLIKDMEPKVSGIYQALIDKAKPAR